MLHPSLLFDDGKEIWAVGGEAEAAVVDGFKGRDLPNILARVRRAIFAAIRFFANSSRLRHSAFVSC